VTAFFTRELTAALSLRRSQIDQSMPIVAETEEISDFRISPLNSRAQSFDGSGARCSSKHGKNLRWKISALP